MWCVVCGLFVWILLWVFVVVVVVGFLSAFTEKGSEFESILSQSNDLFNKALLENIYI